MAAGAIATTSLVPGVTADEKWKFVHDGLCQFAGWPLSLDEAVCALNALAVLEQELGSLDRVQRVLTVTGFVSSAPDFHQQPAVVDGASKVLADVFGEAGRHTRSAIGVAALPRNGAVEIEVTVAVSD